MQAHTNMGAALWAAELRSVPFLNSGSSRHHLLVVDSREIIHFAFRSLSEQSRIDWHLAIAADISQAREYLLANRVSAVLLGPEIGCDGFDSIAEIREAAPGVPVGLLLAEANAAAVRTMQRLKAQAVFPLSLNRQEMLEGIFRLFCGESFVPQQVYARTVFAPNNRESQRGGRGSATSPEQPIHLTPREREILDLLVRGDSNKEIARSLDISVGTAKNYVAKLFQRFDVSSRLRLVSLLRERYAGLLVAMD